MLISLSRAVHTARVLVVFEASHRGPLGAPGPVLGGPTTTTAFFRGGAASDPAPGTEGLINKVEGPVNKAEPEGIVNTTASAVLYYALGRAYGHGPCLWSRTVFMATDRVYGYGPCLWSRRRQDPHTRWRQRLLL